MKYKTKAKGGWHKASVRSAATGIKMARIRLDGSDLKELAAMSDPDLCATVRQLSARVNRFAPTYYPHQRTILDFLGRQFHTGGFVKGTGLKRGEVPVVLSTPTGRRPSWPEMQFIGETRTGRWSSTMPQKSQMPRTEWPEPEGGFAVDESHHFKHHMPASKGGKVGGRVTFEKTAATGKSESAFVGMDFAGIERRVLAQCGVSPGLMQMSSRRHGKRAAVEVELGVRDMVSRVFAKVAVDMAINLLQDQIDEEGCGPVFAAMKEWN